jgi:hypothetical protein
MNKAAKSAFLAIAIATASVGVQHAAESAASAAPSCAGAGNLCFYDNASGQYGNFAGDNNVWGDYGWHDRADKFKNDGRTHHACVYEHEYRGGVVWWIRRDGQWYYPPANTIDSNAWTTGDVFSCPRY